MNERFITTMRKELAEHVDNICFQQAVNPGVSPEIFEKEYEHFYPDNTKHFKEMTK